MKEYYERLYKENRTHFGTAPSPLALLLMQQCRHGTLLDIGCGQGRDALYFASKGMHIIAIDISPAAITEVLRQAEHAGLKIDARERDMWDLPQIAFDAIFSDFALQMIAPNQRQAYMEKLKVTYPDAIHAHVVPLSGVAFDKEFIFGDMLKTAYADWNILFYEEAWTLAPAPNKNGEPYLIREAKIMAKKPVNVSP
jgi:tellurite methyltransferase